MGLFPKNAGSRLFNAGFAISAEDSTLIDIAEELENNELDENAARDYSDIGCADVVHLLHSLPRKGNQTELHAIVKTFEVLGISVQSLLDDARRKKQLTDDRLNALDQEINRLNEELEQRREETNILNLGLEELNKLEDSLIRMVDLESQDHDRQPQDQDDEPTMERSKASIKSKGDDRDGNERDDLDTRSQKNRSKDAEPVAYGDAYLPQGEDLIETQKIIDLDRVPKSKTSMAEKIRSKSVRKRRDKNIKNRIEA